MAARNLMSETLAHLRGLGVKPSIEWAAPGSIAELKWAEDGHAFSLNSVGSVFIGKGVRICCRYYPNPDGPKQAERWFDPKAETLADIIAFVESPEEEG